MPFSDTLHAAVTMPGFWLLVFAVTLAGLVRGFSGFGSALVYMPLASLVLSPAEAVAVIVVVDLIGPLANIPNALRTGSPKEIGALGIGLVPGLAIGLVALFLIPPEAFRWAVSLLALATVAALVSGWQWRGRRDAPATLAVGFLSGIVGGATALPGPPVVLYYMASPLPIAVIRANLTMFLVSVDLALICFLLATSSLTWATATLSLVLLLPFSLANGIGSALFRPERARAYKLVSWGLIAASALMGLPLWTG